MQTQCLENIPEAQVPDTVKDFIESGGIKITATKQSDGNWTVCADIDK